MRFVSAPSPRAAVERLALAMRAGRWSDEFRVTSLQNRKSIEYARTKDFYVNYGAVIARVTAK